MHAHGTMNHAPHGSSAADEKIDERVDEAVAESFPASDAPSWNATHAGGPAPYWETTGHAAELRGQLRGDLDALGQWVADKGQRIFLREEFVARTMLDAGPAVVREPLDGPHGVRNVESALGGVVRGAPCVVLATRYDDADATRVAMLLAVVRALAGARLARPLRFAAIADSAKTSGAARYAERLSSAGTRVKTLVFVGAMPLSRTRPGRVGIAGDMRSVLAVAAAGDAFQQASRLPSRVLHRPSFWPTFPRKDMSALRRLRVPIVVLTDLGSGPAPSRPPDVDRMAAAVPGLVAIIERLGGGRL